jgi:hypothetical protein
MKPESLVTDGLWWHDWLGYEVLRREATAAEADSP